MLRAIERDARLVNKDGTMSDRLAAYLDDLTRAINSIPPLVGSGSPEGGEVANVGRWYVDQDAVDTGIYLKESGTGDTGWVKRS